MQTAALRSVAATRYVTPLREGGSLPAIVEADDDGLYVLKFRGAGQGPKALVAEVIAGELARALGLRVPDLVAVDLVAELARTEPDPEIQDLIRASVGVNLGVDYLPGSITFDPAAVEPDEALASEVVWLDALVSNVDRTPRNANMLVWHKRIWLIDHGASLYFHHAPGDFRERARAPFAQIKDHILLPHATKLHEADASLAPRLTPEVVRSVVALVPDAWLGDGEAGEADALRSRYVDYLLARLEAPRAFAEEAIDARAR